MVDGRWSRVVDRGLRVTGRGSVARAPNSRRTERLLRGHSGGVARLPCRQRHSDQHRFQCVVPCRSARIVEIGGSPVRVNWKTAHSIARSLAHEQGAFQACERCDFFVRVRRDLSHTNVKFGTAFRFLGATLHRAERLFVAQTFGLFRVISGSRVDGRVRRTSKACELRFCGRGGRGAVLLYRRYAAVIRCCSI
jgi:hypothetical protein